MKKFFALGAVLLILGFCISGCGKTFNIFGWTHAEGKSKDPDVLLQDADAALAKGDYQVAMDYYNKVIDSDPDNSLARYGYVTAYMKQEFKDMNISELLTQLSNSDSESGGMLIDESKINLSTQDLIDMGNVLVNYLDDSATGNWDGEISSTDVGMNVNLAFGYMLQAVGTVIDGPNKDGIADYNYQKDSEGNYKLVDNSGNEINPDTLGDTVKNDVTAKLDSAIQTIQKTIIANPEVGMLNDIKSMLTDLKTEITTNT